MLAAKSDILDFDDTILNTMDQATYLDERVQDQIDWYDRKSKINKNWFLTLRVIEIIVALLIPFASNFISDELPPIAHLVSFLGLVVAAIAGLLSLLKFQENWIEYRSTSEALKHEKYLFLTNSGSYQSEDSFNQFVSNIEALISKEHSKWKEVVNSQAEQQQPGQ